MVAWLLILQWAWDLSKGTPSGGRQFTLPLRFPNAILMDYITTRYHTTASAGTSHFCEWTTTSVVTYCHFGDGKLITHDGSITSCFLEIGY